MKSKLKLSVGILLLLAVSAGVSFAQFSSIGGVGGQTIDPATGLPVSPPPTQFDPTTGQPIPPPTQQWMDANWNGDPMQLTNVSFNDVPISEVARDLRSRYDEQFDLVLPTQSTSENMVNPLTGMPLEARDWTSMPIRLQLRNVGASEVFGAMNLMFENDKTPLRWQLKMNGNRETAILRVLAVPNPAMYANKEVQRRVYFVGDLIGDEKSGGMSMEQIIKTITDVWQMADHSGKGVTSSALGVEVGSGTIQFHKEAELLIVTGTGGQIDLMEQTLKALEQKVAQEKGEPARRTQLKGADTKPKADDLKPAAR
jgi:hypothetical protein